LRPARIYVIGHPSDVDHEASIVVDDTSDVGIEPVFQVRCDHRQPMLGRKDDVIPQIVISGRHPDLLILRPAGTVER